MITNTVPLERRLDTDLTTLGLLEYPNADGLPVIVLHGIRDLAWGMAPIAERLATRYHVYSLDLRGHGDSDHPGNYSIIAMAADLLAAMDALFVTSAHVVGHSLGARVACMAAAAHPERFESLTMLEGLAPPPQPIAPFASTLHANVERLRKLRQRHSVIPDVADAARRLARAHPRLDRARCDALAARAVRPHPDGGVMWRWAPDIEALWTTSTQEEFESAWGCVEAPVLQVEGELAGEYWGRLTSHSGRSVHAVSPQERARREHAFKHATAILLQGVGHMVHYDAPEKVAELTLDFLATCEQSALPPILPAATKDVSETVDG